MNSILLILAVLGLGAVAVATYVFTVAARNYVSDSASEHEPAATGEEKERQFVERAKQDRRQAAKVIHFPLKLDNGEVVVYDRRVGDRRKVG